MPLPKKWLQVRYSRYSAPIELDPGDLEEVHRQQRRQDPERERPEDAVAKGLALFVARQPENQDSQDQRVVRAEQPFEEHQQTYRQEISGVDVHRLPASLDTPRIKAYI